jgi:hypothetical protein
MEPVKNACRFRENQRQNANAVFWVVVFSRRDFVLPHTPNVALSLPLSTVILGFYPFLCVTMIEAGKWLVSEGKWPFQR